VVDADASLPAAFFARPSVMVAAELLGCLLVRESAEGSVAAVIVETEAYTGAEDPASHAAASIGRTARNDPLFGLPGTAYVHLNYGVHWCLNAVTDAEGIPAAVLIRAAEPVAGRELMRARRGREELTNGPGRLGTAFAIGPALQRHPLDSPPLWIQAGESVPDDARVRTTRIGISKGTDLKLRFYDRRSDWVSRR